MKSLSAGDVKQNVVVEGQLFDDGEINPETTTKHDHLVHRVYQGRNNVSQLITLVNNVALADVNMSHSVAHL